MAARLPGTCLAALEMSLRDPGRGADLSVRLRTPAEGRRAARIVATPYLSAFLERWAAKDRLRRLASEIWLELDLAGGDPPSDDLPPPVVCVRLARPPDPVWLTRELLPEIHGVSALPELQRRAVIEAVELLPPTARLLYAFSLRSRNPPPAEDAALAPVRLEVCGMSADGMRRYVERLSTSADASGSGPIEAEAWDEVFERVGPWIRCAGRNHLSVDLAPGIQPRLGIELSFARRPDREPGWAALFDLLEDGGLLGNGAGRTERRKAVFAWPGWDSFWTASERWPSAAGAAYCVRSLSHVKVVTGPGLQPDAKVYLLFGLWRRSGAERPPRGEAAHGEAAHGETAHGETAQGEAVSDGPP